MAPFYEWASTVSRLQPVREDSLLFTIKPQRSPGTHLLDLEKMKS